MKLVDAHINGVVITYPKTNFTVIEALAFKCSVLTSFVTLNNLPDWSV